MLDYSAIGKRIRMYRKKRLLSQEALAEKVWISTTHMSHIETGSTKLSLPVLVDLSAALGVSTDDILFEPKDEADIVDRAEIEQLLNLCSDEQLRSMSRLIKSFNGHI